MIEFTKSYKTTDGRVFGTIEEAQTHEIEELLNKSITNRGGSESWSKMNLNDWATLLIESKESLINILTTTPNSKPKARRVNGGTKKRKVVISDVVTPTSPTNP